ncbi:hypothetical protein [Pseudosporangium ferrugineum]|uniref:hypothetical protein n=1 Tax=Pseudosporangium ferrugineum TaxID=439699 RepID=UPI0011B28999|nr:hypothetical protein [Pseudosporangium ferrugineum]
MADVERVFTLNQNCGTIRIVVVSNPATIYFNTKNVPVPAVASNQDGNQVVPPVLAAVDVPDETAGANSVVRLRSAGTPTVMVTGY